MKEVVISRPFTTEKKLTREDSLLILACDGLWDVVDDEVAAKIALEKMTAQEASKALLEYALEECSSDNISIYVAKFAWQT